MTVSLSRWGLLVSKTRQLLLLYTSDIYLTCLRSQDFLAKSEIAFRQHPVWASAPNEHQAQAIEASISTGFAVALASAANE